MEKFTYFFIPLFLFLFSPFVSSQTEVKSFRNGEQRDNIISHGSSGPDFAIYDSSQFNSTFLILMVLFGTLLGTFGSFFSIRRFLKSY